MIKDELVFDWDTRDSHRGRKFASFAVVILLFAACFAAFEVKLPVAPDAVMKEVVMIKIPDDDFGRNWQLRAAEEGPFPGGLDISEGENELFSLNQSLFGKEPEWGSYQITPRGLKKNGEAVRQSLAQKGKRFFPERIGMDRSGEGEVPDMSMYSTVPNMIAFSRETEEWLPRDLPEYVLTETRAAGPSQWRFLICLRGNGVVEDCISLDGEGEEAIAEVVAWLRGVRFEPSEEKERWLGVRLEFQNRKKDGN